MLVDTRDANLTLTAPMAGVVARLFVSDGERVLPGQPLGVVESLKLESVLRAPAPGCVRVLVASDEPVHGGQELFVVTQ